MVVWYLKGSVNSQLKMKTLKIVWISAEQKDGRFSALAVHESEPLPGIIQTEKAFVRGTKEFVLGSTIEIPKSMTLMVSDNEWKFST